MKLKDAITHIAERISSTKAPKRSIRYTPIGILKTRNPEHYSKPLTGLLEALNRKNSKYDSAAAELKEAGK